MVQTDRRTFIKQSVVASTSAAVLDRQSRSYACPGSRKLSVALLGCGGRGTFLAAQFNTQPDVEVVWVCDPDQSRLVRAHEMLGSTRFATSDFRKVFEDKTVDAVIVATPDHWHAPASILACQAGKHVYVEKPCSHSIREGRLLVEAARKNKNVVQHGTQVRSTGMMIEAVELLRKGLIGQVLMSKAWNVQRRRSIGHESPCDVPEGLDYDQWVGPAPMMPYQNNRVHNGWHWWYNFGTGDMGNDGVHDIDYARWGLGVEGHPTTVTAQGGKYFFDDDQQFPDTQQVAFEYPGDGASGNRRMLIYEQRLWSTNHPRGVDSGVEFYGTKGLMFLSRRGLIEVFDELGQPVAVEVTPEPQNTDSHIADFIDCIRTGKKPNGDIHIGHLTTTLCHLGNIATRVGSAIQFDPETETITNNDQANSLVTRRYRDHWSVPRTT